ncbi:MAG: PIN domain-containing protein [Candidatus Thorarchaeota archaeon]
MKSKKNIVIIDSNFILLPFQFKIDYFDEIRFKIEGEIRFIIYQQIIDELEAKKKRERRTTNFIRYFESGLSYLEKNTQKYNIEILSDTKEVHESTDNFLLRMLKTLKNENQNIYLATNDSDLRSKAREIKINTIFMRQKKYLSIDFA